MTLIQRVGDWSLRHPIAVLSGFSITAGIIFGARANGLSGAAVGAVIGCGLSLCLYATDPRAPSLGPHQ